MVGAAFIASAIPDGLDFLVPPGSLMVEAYRRAHARSLSESLPPPTHIRGILYIRYCAEKIRDADRMTTQIR